METAYGTIIFFRKSVSSCFDADMQRAEHSSIQIAVRENRADLGQHGVAELCAPNSAGNELRGKPEHYPQVIAAIENRRSKGYNNNLQRFSGKERAD